jgi:hypothetical protein
MCFTKYSYPRSPPPQPTGAAEMGKLLVRTKTAQRLNFAPADGDDSSSCGSLPVLLIIPHGMFRQGRIAISITSG